MERSGGKVVELCGFLSIPPVHCLGEVQGLSRNHGGIARTSSHRGIVVDAGGKQGLELQWHLSKIPDTSGQTAVKKLRCSGTAGVFGGMVEASKTGTLPRR
ncbi:TPA: hypothetical protein ACH3X1_000080 [Trebouxia sp. C0004]